MGDVRLLYPMTSWWKWFVGKVAELWTLQGFKCSFGCSSWYYMLLGGTWWDIGNPWQAVDASASTLGTAFLSLPGPPNFFLSLQNLHMVQSGVWHPSHWPHLLCLLVLAGLESGRGCNGVSIALSAASSSYIKFDCNNVIFILLFYFCPIPCLCCNFPCGRLTSAFSQCQDAYCLSYHET